MRFSTGLMAGSIVAAVGVGYAMSDRRTKKKMMKTGKRLVHKTQNYMDNMF